MSLEIELQRQGEWKDGEVQEQAVQCPEVRHGEFRCS